MSMWCTSCKGDFLQNLIFKPNSDFWKFVFEMDYKKERIWNICQKDNIHILHIFTTNIQKSNLTCRCNFTSKLFYSYFEFSTEILHCKICFEKCKPLINIWKKLKYAFHYCLKYCTDVSSKQFLTLSYCLTYLT